MMAAIDTAKAVLAKASLFDQTFATPDLGIAVAWSEALGDLDKTDAMRAVTEHYASQTRRIMPADVIAGVRRIRRDRIERQAENVDYDAEDVAGGIDAIRGHRQAIASGQRPVQQLLESTLARMPKVPDVDHSSSCGVR